MGAMSKVKQNFHSDSEALINKQINMELYASYVYLSMSAYFARDDIALMGFSKRFRDASNEEKEHAESLIDYQNMRGGRVVFREIAKPTCDNGEQHWKPLRQASSLRRLSTSPSSTCTRWPTVMEMLRWLTTSRALILKSKLRPSRKLLTLLPK